MTNESNGSVNDESELEAARRRFPHDLGGDQGRIDWHRAHPEETEEAKEGLGVGEDEVRAAMEVLRRSVVGKNPPLVLAEFGPAMTDKYLFMRLDWVDQVQDAKAIGFRP